MVLRAGRMKARRWSGWTTDPIWREKLQVVVVKVRSNVAIGFAQKCMLSTIMTLAVIRYIFSFSNFFAIFLSSWLISWHILVYFDNL